MDLLVSSSIGPTAEQRLTHDLIYGLGTLKHCAADCDRNLRWVDQQVTGTVGAAVKLSKVEIESLHRQEPISLNWPWSTGEQGAVEKNIKDIVAAVRRTCRLSDRTEYNHYGSGYSSYVDCWLYRANDDFRFEVGDSYCGLVVLFSRLSHYFVVGEGKKAWKGTTSSSYLPDFHFVNNVSYPSILSVLPKVCEILQARGLERLYSADLADLLPSEIVVPTILTDRAWRQFDALFYWED